MPTIRDKINKEFIYKLDENGGKRLESGFRRKIFLYQRNRTDSTYYLTTVKGNYIKSYKIQHLLDGKPQNLFMAFVVGGLIDPQSAREDANSTKTIKTLIVKSPINKHDEHLKNFMEATPDLNWFKPGWREEEDEDDNPTL